MCSGNIEAVLPLLKTLFNFFYTLHFFLNLISRDISWAFSSNSLISNGTSLEGNKLYPVFIFFFSLSAKLA